MASGTRGRRSAAAAWPGPQVRLMDEVMRFRLFRYVFKFYNGRFPDAWEQVLGVAQVEGQLAVKQPPSAAKAPVLWRVHEAAVMTQAALGLVGPNPLPEREGI